ncbi:MAG TPA: RluA family pseudouridine synthase, partial [Candidatus Saccharimonadales bacterium]|nr:RluA family pseudouridine synthase [Candidatus Saccharimonadales bacterium]
MTSFKVSKTDEGQRADIFVASRYPDFTRSSLERLFDKGLVTTAQSPLKAGQKLHAGQKITVDDHLLRVVPPAIDLPVIYEDDNVIVIDKPAGVLTHSKGALNSESTVASFISDRISPELTGNRAGIVHRLDRATSGVIITAKNSATQKYLQKQFSTRKVIKTYLAIVEGEPEPAQAIVDAPIARNPAKPQTFKVAATGKPAVTEYKVLKILNKSSS